MIQMTSEWSQSIVTFFTIIGSGISTNLQNDFQPFSGYETGGNALFDRSAHSDGPEVIEIDVFDKAPRAAVIDRRHCSGRTDGKCRA
jgi:hypothetical protein